jgi:hypothetical protein
MQVSGLFVPVDIVAAEENMGTLHPSVPVKLVHLADALLFHRLNIPLILGYGIRRRRFGERGGGL